MLKHIIVINLLILSSTAISSEQKSTHPTPACGITIIPIAHDDNGFIKQDSALTKLSPSTNQIVDFVQDHYFKMAPTKEAQKTFDVFNFRNVVIAAMTTNTNDLLTKTKLSSDELTKKMAAYALILPLVTPIALLPEEMDLALCQQVCNDFTTLENTKKIVLGGTVTQIPRLVRHEQDAKVSYTMRFEWSTASDCMKKDSIEQKLPKITSSLATAICASIVKHCAEEK